MAQLVERWTRDPKNGGSNTVCIRGTRKICEFFQAKNVVLTRCRCAQPLCVYARIRMITYTRYRVRSSSPRQSAVDYRNMKRSSMHFKQLGSGSATLLQLVFLGGKRPGFPTGEISIGTTKCTKYKNKKENQPSTRLECNAI